MNEENQPIVDNSTTYQEPNNINVASQSAPKADSNKSLISLICGIVGLVFAGLPCGIVAIIFSRLAKKEGSADGKATAGLILGIVDIIKAILTVVIYVIYFVIAFASYSYDLSY